MVISVSTRSFKFTIPASAWFIRRLPSKENGLVTTPTVSAPASRAHSATMGAAPVPVPPPIPAVTKTMSAPRNCSTRSSLDSSAAFCPISGLAPAPKPLVSFSPIWIRFCALESSRAWASQLIAINSTPCSPEVIMRFTALLPPPPTPTTLIFASVSGVMPESAGLFMISSNIFGIPLLNNTTCCYYTIQFKNKKAHYVKAEKKFFIKSIFSCFTLRSSNIFHNYSYFFRYNRRIIARLLKIRMPNTRITIR